MTSTRATGAALAAIFALFVAAASFVHPVADDFDFASARREARLWTAWRQQYLTWNGRYSSNLLALAIPLRQDTTTPYRVVVAAMVAATPFALYWLLSAMSDGVFTRSEIGVAALLLSLLYVGLMPSLGEGIYWYTSAVTYHAAALVTVGHLACVARSLRTRTTVAPAAAFVLLAIAAGFNEVLALGLVVFYAVLTAVTMSERSPHRVLFAMMLTAAAACAAVVAASPGNAARVAEYPQRHRAAASAAMTIVQTARFLAAWTTSGALLLGSALWIPQARRLAIHVSRAAARRTAALAVAGIVAAVPIAAFPAYWATGILGQHRTIDMACLFFVLLWFIAIGAWAASGDRLPMLIGDAVAHVRGPLTALLLLALVASTNAARLIDDAARGRLTAFDREAGARAAALQDCHRLGRTFCAVDPIATIPASFFFVDISDNPRDWVNVAYARYFGVEDVRRRSREAEHVRD